MPRRAESEGPLQIGRGHIIGLVGLAGIVVTILGAFFVLFRNVAMQDQAVDKKVYEAQHEALQSNVKQTADSVEKVKDGLANLQTKQAVMDSKLDEVKTQMGKVSTQVEEVLRAVLHPKGKDS